MAKRKRRSKKHFYVRRFTDLGELARFYHEQTGKKLQPETIKHEAAHYDKARELGYEPEYELRFGRNCFTRITIEIEEEVSDEDLIAIANAPENPSWEDNMTIKNVQERLKVNQ